MCSWKHTMGIEEYSFQVSLIETKSYAFPPFSIFYRSCSYFSSSPKVEYLLLRWNFCVFLFLEMYRSQVSIACTSSHLTSFCFDYLACFQSISRQHIHFSVISFIDLIYWDCNWLSRNKHLSHLQTTDQDSAEKYVEFMIYLFLTIRISEIDWNYRCWNCSSGLICGHSTINRIRVAGHEWLWRDHSLMFDVSWG